MEPRNIDKEITDLRGRLFELYELKDELQLKDKNLIGKFIKDPDRGYMYVTYQSIDKVHLGDTSVLLQGISFSSYKSDKYRDTAYMTFDALDDWYIPKDAFLNGNDIVEVSKSEFINEFKLAFNDSVEFGLKWINSIIEDDK